MPETFQHEHVAMVPRGYKVRTVTRGDHEIRVAFPPGRRVRGAGRLVEILHPAGENPLCKIVNLVNPSTLELKRKTRDRSRRIREARSNPYFSETLTQGSRSVLIWANEPEGPYHLRPYLNFGETPATRELSARPLKSLEKARKRARMWLAAMSHSNPAIRTGYTREGDKFEWLDIGQKWEVVGTHPGGREFYRQAYPKLVVSVKPKLEALFRKMLPQPAGHNPAKSVPEQHREKVLAILKKMPKPIRDVFNRNPDDDEFDAAEGLYEEFHGRAPREILEMQESSETRGEYTALGELVELTMIAGTGDRVQIKFASDGVRVASSPNGEQLYLLGGNQDISGSLKLFGVDENKDLIDLGEAKQIVYEAAKWQTDFTPQEWKHDFGEESGVRPRAFFDQLKKRIFFAGGNYQVKRPGIVD
jgi:hypothetical protein